VGILRRTVTNKTSSIQHYFIFGKYYTAEPGQTIVVEKIEEIDDDEKYYSKTEADKKYCSKIKADELMSGLLKGSFDSILETFVIEG